LNETLFMESAQALARRMVTDGGKSDADRISHGFRLCTSRKPSDDETKELAGLLERQARRISEGWVSPWQLSTGKEQKPQQLPEGVTPTQLAAYTVVARVLLNLDETITRE
jgi:hypothetical protein